MLYSMTAFAQLQRQCCGLSLSWEIRSVNHRYLEPSFRLPEQHRNQENALRQTLKNTVARGKVDATLRIEDDASQTPALEIDPQALATLNNAISQVMAGEADVAAPDALAVLRWPGIINEPKIDSDNLAATISKLFAETLEELVQTRAREGEKLGEAVTSRLDAIDAILVQVEKDLPEQLALQHDKLKQKVEALGDVDPARLEQELVILAQKSDSSEEVDRLTTHVNEVRRVVSKGGVCGRRLDFLMQELNREANTLSSKSIAASISQAAVELKVLIEQMREQIQNIE
jgi:uncharacterized protein (TIGR00255 family)